MKFIEQYKILKRGQVRLFTPYQFAGLFLLAILSAFTGWFFLEDLLSPPASIATIDLHSQSLAGQNAVELSFWLAIFLGNILSFRTLEVFFRQGFGRFVRDFPLLPQSVFLNRFRHATIEGGSLAFIGSAFFVPLLISQPLIGSAAILNLVTSYLVALPLSIAAFLYVGATLSSEQRLIGDAYGGGGAAFIYGPILGFALVAFTSLGIKLGVGELLFRKTISNAFVFVFLVVGFIFLFSFKNAYSNFSKHYYLLIAKFNEADATHFDIGNQYQLSDYPGKSSFLGLGFPVAALARAFQLQYRRRFPVQRSIEKIGIFILAVFFLTREKGAIPYWAIVMSGPLLFGALSNPWYRISKLPGRLEFISLEELGCAKSKLARVEILPFAILSTLVPMALLLLKFGANTSIVFAGLTSSLLLVNYYLFFQLKDFRNLLTRYIPPLGIILAVATVAFLGPFLGFVIVVCVSIPLAIASILRTKNPKTSTFSDE